MTWRDYLTPEEAARLEAIPVERRALTKEYKAIFERCRKRAERAGTKAGQETGLENQPKNDANLRRAAKTL